MALTETSHEEVRIAVVVVIANSDSLSVTSMKEAHFFRNVDKRPITLIAEQPAGGRLDFGCRIGRELTSLHQEQVHVTVLIVIEPGDSPAHDFGKVVHGCVTINVKEIDPGRLSEVLKADDEGVAVWRGD